MGVGCGVGVGYGVADLRDAHHCGHVYQFVQVVHLVLEISHKAQYAVHFVRVN